MVVRLATATVNAAANAACDLADGGAAAGTLKIRTGVQPASANDAASGTLLATFTLADPAFAAGVAGVKTLDADPDLTTVGLAAGTAGWARLESSTPGTVMDFSVTATGGGGDIEVDNVSIAVDQNVTITAGTVTMPAG
jgi:hypothetical protein